jgi:hypothetical protein
MSTSLTNEEKLNIVNQHIKSVDYAIYGCELDLIEANAASSPDTAQIAALNARLSEANAKKNALVEEKESLTITE